MDAILFDRLTRRFVVAGLPGGSLAALLGVFEAASKKKKKSSKRKRCRKKERKFCSGRCCPKRHRCEAKTCVQSCENPFVCPDQGGGSGCGAGTNCFCSTTIRGTTACVISEPAPCDDFEPCGPADSCPAGLICAICGCFVDDTPEFRCKRPCPAG